MKRGFDAIRPGMIKLAQNTAFLMMEPVFICERGALDHEQFTYGDMPDGAWDLCVAIVTPDLAVFPRTHWKPDQE